MRVGKLKNGKATDKDQITGEIIKGGGDRVVDWNCCVIWKWEAGTGGGWSEKDLEGVF